MYTNIQKKEEEEEPINVSWGEDGGVEVGVVVLLLLLLLAFGTLEIEPWTGEPGALEVGKVLGVLLRSKGVGKGDGEGEVTPRYF